MPNPNNQSLFQFLSCTIRRVRVPQTIVIASTTLLFYSLSTTPTITTKLTYFYCRASSSTRTSSAFLHTSASTASDLTPNNKNTFYSSSYCSSSSFLAANNNNYNMDQQDNEKPKSTQDLQSQWAGGRDIWKDVPILSSSISSSSSSPINKIINIQTKVNEDSNPNHSNLATKECEWPDIVKSSILFGFGAYNPRGQTLPDEINKRQHSLLENDIQHGLKERGFRSSFWWQGASLWEDGTSERGFIVAFQRSTDTSTSTNDYLDKANEFIIELATKYNQGAVYKFEYVDGKLMRDTISVLDPGTDATVEVLRDDDVNIDLSIFQK